MTELERFIAEAEDCGIEMKRNQPLSQFSTWRIGGEAKVLFMPKEVGQVAEIVQIADRLGQRLEVLSFGSNILFSDEGMEAGICLRLLKDVEIDGDCVKAQAGVSLGYLANLLAQKGWADLAFACGIPGSLGGAAVMNAGCYGREIGQYIKAVQAVDEHGKIISLPKEECGFAYRRSRFMQEKMIVTAAELKVCEAKEVDLIRATLEEYRQRRKNSQPYEWPNAGSVFKNPPNDSAGRLIEGAGLKGLRVGDAQVSEKHANFIINLAQAKAGDVISLMKQVRSSVEEKYGVLLEPEVKFCGFKTNPLI